MKFTILILCIAILNVHGLSCTYKPLPDGKYEFKAISDLNGWVAVGINDRRGMIGSRVSILTSEQTMGTGYHINSFNPGNWKALTNENLGLSSVSSESVNGQRTVTVVLSSFNEIPLELFDRLWLVCADRGDDQIQKHKNRISQEFEVEIDISIQTTTPPTTFVEAPTMSPTMEHMGNHTMAPTMEHMGNHTLAPTMEHMGNHTMAPTMEHMGNHTMAPTMEHTGNHTMAPTMEHMGNHTMAPTMEHMDNHTMAPTMEHMDNHTMAPTMEHVDNHTMAPTMEHMGNHTLAPTMEHMGNHTMAPTMEHMDNHTMAPTMEHVENHTMAPTMEHMDNHTMAPTIEQMDSPTLAPTMEQMDSPTLAPTAEVVNRTLRTSSDVIPAMEPIDSEVSAFGSNDFEKWSGGSVALTNKFVSACILIVYFLA